ncbi:hypothetical protein FA13DRAFT_1813867 [Coprinellus micaceus]|uniref:Uncharacterized protein n=1 Tax=Coprinellus micaceus TaxID=71717 RepID=A0A4Y7TC12_COPMI|nr:hypothetical protein FA13DRAFT_1813867 [Coprinellus micaceus]
MAKNKVNRANGKGQPTREEPRDISGDPVVGTIHVATHKANRNPDDPDFKAMDDALCKKVDEVVSQWGVKGAENPGAVVKQALSRNMTWDDIERGFTQSKFWMKVANSYKKNTSSLDAHDGLTTLERFTTFWSRDSKQARMDKQIEKGKRHVPKAKVWFDKFVDDPDFTENFQLKENSVLDELTLLSSARPQDHYDMTEKSFLDIGIVRIPDYQFPEVKVFRIKLTVWHQYNKDDSIFSGIRGELISCKYCPRDRSFPQRDPSQPAHPLMLAQVSFS